MAKSFYDAMKLRRSYYGFTKEELISKEKLQELVEYSVKHTPSAFNSQTARVVLLLNDEHNKLWELVKTGIKSVVDDEAYKKSALKVDNSFKCGYGTILFFEDMSIVENLQEKFPLYKDNFPIWSLESNGMLQYNIWTSLALEGYGASLQHYNELIESDVKKEWNLPEEWQLRAQMPFGKTTSEAGEKEFEPLDKRVKVFK